MIEELSKFWIRETSQLTAIYGHASKVDGSDDSGVNFWFGQYLALFVGKSGDKFAVTTIHFNAGTNVPSEHSPLISSTSFVAAAEDAARELIANWTLHSNSSKIFLDKAHAQNQ